MSHYARNHHRPLCGSDDWDIALEVDQYYIVKRKSFFFSIKYHIAITTSIGVIYTNQWWRTIFISGGWSRDGATEPSVGPVPVGWTSRELMDITRSLTRVPPVTRIPPNVAIEIPCEPLTRGKYTTDCGCERYNYPQHGCGDSFTTLHATFPKCLALRCSRIAPK
jgi:hypothetical protein